MLSNVDRTSRTYVSYRGYVCSSLRDECLLGVDPLLRIRSCKGLIVCGHEFGRLPTAGIGSASKVGHLVCKCTLARILCRLAWVLLVVDLRTTDEFLLDNLLACV